MRRRQWFGWGAQCALLLASLLAASPAGALGAPDRVSVLTMGPGDHPFTRFGHNALLLEWDEGQHRENAVYNFGTFEFRGLSGVRDFMAGRFRYWLSVTSLERTVRAYAADNRSLIAQELALRSDERFELYRALADNALPEHRYYDYDYYQDNCSTRVRDALNQVLSGSLQQGVVGPGRLTFRQHTLALTGDTPWLYFGLDVALGTPTDRPTTRWQELFLPQELHDALGHASRELGGRRVPLVLRETELLRAARAPLPRDPPARSLAFGTVGLALGGAFAALGRAARNQRAGRVLFGVLTALFGLALGLLGSALVIFWASKHWAAHANASLLGCPPWALALVGLGVAFALGRPHGLRKLRWLLGTCAISASALLLMAVAQSGHESMRMALLFLPLWTGALWGARLAEPRGALKP